MILWVDAQISPSIAKWIKDNYSFDATAVRDLGLREATDREIFDAAKSMNAVVMTKDSDFVLLLERLGPPPKVIWLTCGNCSNAQLKTILNQVLPKAVELLESGESLVEINS